MLQLRNLARLLFQSPLQLLVGAAKFGLHCIFLVKQLSQLGRLKLKVNHALLQLVPLLGMLVQLSFRLLQEQTQQR